MKRVIQSIALLSILLASTAVFAQKAKPISSGVINSKAISLPSPAYPPAARAVRASGAVSVQVTVDETGKVISAEAVSGHPLLRKAAEDAAKEAEFKPFMLGGKAVTATGILVYNFMPDGKVVAPKANAKEGAKKTEDAKTEDKEETGDKAQSDGARNTASTSETPNPAGAQMLEGRYKNSGSSMVYLTFHTDGTFVKATAGVTAGVTYGTESPGTYSIQGNTITLKYNDGNTEQYSFELLENKDLKINGVKWWVWNN
jgi:TonB family protein